MRDSLIATVQTWHGPGGLGALTLMFMIGAVLYVPRFALYLIGGAMFGWVAAPVALIGTTIGAVIAFLLARHLMHDWVRERVDRLPTIRTLFTAIDAESWRLVALVRLGSPLPGGMINYLFGITRIGLWQYVTATFVGLLVPIGSFVTFGILGRMVLTDLEGSRAQQIGVLVVLIVVAVALLLVFRRIMTASAASVRR